MSLPTVLRAIFFILQIAMNSLKLVEKEVSGSTIQRIEGSGVDGGKYSPLRYTIGDLFGQDVLDERR